MLTDKILANKSAENLTRYRGDLGFSFRYYKNAFSELLWTEKKFPGETTSIFRAIHLDTQANSTSFIWFSGIIMEFLRGILQSCASFFLGLLWVGKDAYNAPKTSDLPIFSIFRAIHLNTQGNNTNLIWFSGIIMEFPGGIFQNWPHFISSFLRGQTLIAPKRYFLA